MTSIRKIGDKKMKTCDRCGKNLGLIKFRYSTGHICKDCYKAASRNFTETVREKSLEDISSIIENTSMGSLDEDFQVSAKIGNFLLIDKKREKFHIIDRKADSGKSRIYRFSDVKHHEIITVPRLSSEELIHPTDNTNKIIRSMSVKLTFNSAETPYEIIVVSTPMRLNSRAYKMSLDFVIRISAEFDKYARKSKIS